MLGMSKPGTEKFQVGREDQGSTGIITAKTALVWNMYITETEL
jgi:hypothetical protein